jgi:hypothetical protein
LVFTRVLPITIYSDLVDIPFPNVVRTGDATGTITGALRDTDADFSGIQVGDIVHNNSVLKAAYVTGIQSNIILELSDSIFSNGDSYTIYQGQNYGCYLHIPSEDYSGGTFKMMLETIGGDIIEITNPPAGVLPIQIRKVISTDVLKLRALW